MKILYIIDTLKIGGKARRFLELLKGVNNIFEVVLVYYDKNVFYEKEIKNLNAKIYSIKRCNNYSFLGFLELINIIKKERPSIIHSWMLIATCKILIVKYVFNFKLIDGSIASADGEKNNFKTNLLYNFSFRFSDVIVANSKVGINSFNAPIIKSMVIYNGFDFGRVADIKKINIPNIKKCTYIIGMIARFDDDKDYESFFTAAIKLLSINHDLIFITIGDGKNLDNFKGRYSKIPNFLFTGAVKNPLDYIDMFDICVLTTYTEGISNTLLEYMAFSKPIVTTNCPGTTELLENNKEAILIPPSSPNYLFNAIYKLLNNKSKMDLLGKNANEKLKKSFSIFNMISNYNKLYLSLFK